MIICAALRIWLHGLDHDTIIPCRRHGEGYDIIRDFKQSYGCIRFGHVDEGFIDHTGKFYNRVDALAHAKECGQLPETVFFYKDDNKLNDLDSEDLY